MRSTVPVVREVKHPPVGKFGKTMNPETIVFFNGEFVRYADAKIGLMTHGLQYGTGCFEGIRGFWVPEDRELYLFQLREHYDRLAISAKILTMVLPFTTQQLIDLTVELCRRNTIEGDVYIRPFICKSAEDVGVRLHDAPELFAMVPVPHTPYVKKPNGLDAAVSAWRRADDTMAPPRAKITGLYINSALAKSQAVADGYDEAILLSHDGHVSEASAANIFMVRDGVLLTPDPSQNVLEGCTRKAILTIAKEQLKIEIIERSVDRGELYAADEIFFTGTAIGIVPVASVDRRIVGSGSVGPVTAKLRAFYDRVVRAQESQYDRWITRVYQPSPAVR